MRIALLVALVACNKTVDTSASDTDTGGDSDVPADRDEAGALFAAVHEPVDWFRRVEGWVDGNATCPSVSKVDATHWTITGGCTDADGTTWAGSAEFLRADIGRRVGFLDLRATTADDDLVYDGEIVIDIDDDVLVAEYAVRLPDDSLVYSYDGLRFETYTSFGEVFTELGAGSYAMSGGFSAVGSGVFEVTGHATDGGQCSQEPDEGLLDLGGARTLTYTINGSVICDGCLPFTDGSRIGEVCPWRDD